MSLKKLNTAFQRRAKPARPLAVRQQKPIPQNYVEETGAGLGEAIATPAEVISFLGITSFIIRRESEEVE
jgi:hypothetical protein